MARIFISHAVADQKLAAAFTAFLKEAIGVPAADIFCSSVDGHGIPTGENFSEYMKDKIAAPDLVIMLITETYLEREFCLMELGATWAKSLKPYPLIVSPVEFDFVTRTLGLVQAQKIDDHKKLNQLRQALRDVCELEPRNDEDWDDKRDEWKLTLKRILPKLPNASKVNAESYQKLEKSVDALNARLSEAEDELDKKDEMIAALKAAKDARDVADIVREFSDKSVEETFNQHIDAVKDAKPSGIYDSVFKHLIMDHYDKAKRINWYSSDAEDFRDAITRNLIDPDSEAVKWGTNKMTKLRKALEALDYFMGDPDHKAFKKSLESQGYSTDTDDLDFWDENL